MGDHVLGTGKEGWDGLLGDMEVLRNKLGGTDVEVLWSKRTVGWWPLYGSEGVSQSLEGLVKVTKWYRGLVGSYPARACVKEYERLAAHVRLLRELESVTVR